MKRYGWRRLALAVEAAFWLLTAWLALRLVPFRFLVGTLSPRVTHPAPQGTERRRIVRQVCWAVMAAARRFPIPIVCFPRAIAAQRMLARRGVATRLPYGVRRELDGSLLAHVWVDVDHVTVLGNPTTGFSIVTIFGK
ncbi:lasso peptide biosynthesis B2 protein [Azospirillum sp. CT11-132]|uniref:lasso peptide biosynthesis B2 protein n=1 Tax=Azospirillum sp. CT11-132 TaxID=3396317 RepID=UPI0039A494A4